MTEAEIETLHLPGKEGQAPPGTIGSSEEARTLSQGAWPCRRLASDPEPPEPACRLEPRSRPLLTAGWFLPGPPGAVRAASVTRASETQRWKAKNKSLFKNTERWRYHLQKGKKERKATSLTSHSHGGPSGLLGRPVPRSASLPTEPPVP